MKTQDLLVIGAVGLGAYYLITSKFGEGLQSGLSGVGTGLSEVGNAAANVGGTIADTSQFIRRNVNTIETYGTQTIELPKTIAAAVVSSAGKSVEQYVASQPKVLNPVQGTRKQLSANSNKSVLPIVISNPKTGQTTKTLTANPLYKGSGLFTAVQSAVSSIPRGVTNIAANIVSSVKKLTAKK